MRGPTVLALALVTMMVGCGGDGDGGSTVPASECVVIPIGLPSSGCSFDPIDLRFACNRDYPQPGPMDTMTVYVSGKRIARDEWAPVGDTTFTLKAAKCDHPGWNYVSVSFACDASNLVMPDGNACTGYINADLQK